MLIVLCVISRSGRQTEEGLEKALVLQCDDHHWLRSKKQGEGLGQDNNALGQQDDRKFDGQLL
jgi:hypothetical protein